MLFSPWVSASTIHVFPRTYRDPASPQWWNCQSRIQRTEETWLKPTLCSASILEIPHRHRNLLKQIRLDMLSTNTNQDPRGMGRNNWKCTFESSGKAYAFGVSYLVYRYLVKIVRKLESSHATLRIEKILETSLAKFEKFWWRTIAMKKWKCFGIASELEIFGANWLIILLWMQRLQKKDK